MSRDFPGADRNPQQTERRILEVLANLHPYASLPKRRINRMISGTDFMGATHTYAALGRLANRKLVIDLRGADQWRLTEAGRAALALDDELSGGAA